jgi:Transposase DDE domain
MGMHHNSVSHDQMNRFMRKSRLRPRHLWQEVRGDVVAHAEGYLLFDDTTLNKEYSRKIEIAQKQYSGALHGLVMGINVVTCVYVNPETEQHWVIDYRIYNPIADGKNKLEHVADMLRHTVEWKRLAFKVVLFDSWYATHEMMKLVDDLGKVFYCPIKTNRNVQQGLCWKKVTDVEWNEQTLTHGQSIRLKGQKQGLTLRLYRMERAANRSNSTDYEYIVTNDRTIQDSSAVIQRVGIRWKIEELHREVKQVTAIEKCQCRKARAQRNHIACAIMAWVALKRAAYAMKTTIYQLKQSLLDSYINQMLNNPTQLLVNITKTA